MAAVVGALSATLDTGTDGPLITTAQVRDDVTQEVNSHSVMAARACMFVPQRVAAELPLKRSALGMQL